MAYEKQTFLDKIIDENGNVVQEGTVLNSSHLGHIEDGILQAHLILDSSFVVKKILGANRFDANAITTGYYVNPNNGALASNDLYSTTDFIPVVPGEVITYQYGTPTVHEGRTIGTMTFLVAYDADKNYVSGERNLTSYTVPDGVSYIRLSSTGLSTGSNIAVVASGEKQDYEPYEVRTVRVLSSDSYDDEHIREIAEEAVSKHPDEGGV